jgi:hypothetical protein
MSEAKDFLLVKVDSDTNPRLIGAFDEDKNFILSLGDGEQVKVTTDDTRELWRHKKFFLLLGAVIDNLPDYLTTEDLKTGQTETLAKRYPTKEKLLIELKIQLGMIDLHYTLDGREVWMTTNSISFGRMGEKKFKTFVDECREVILRRFLSDMSPHDFDENLYKLIFA